MAFIDYSNTKPSFELDLLKWWESKFLEFANARLSVNKMYELKETNVKVLQFENGRIRANSPDHSFCIIIAPTDDQFLFRYDMMYCNLLNFQKILNFFEKEK